METSGLTNTGGKGSTDTVLIMELVQPKLFVPVIVYDVVEVGVAITLLPTVEDRSVEGAHE
jgi:hypothetical protein